MIDKALRFISLELSAHLGMSDGVVVVGRADRLTEEDTVAGSYIALVHITQDVEFHHARKANRQRVVLPVLYVLCAFACETYETSLRNLGSAVELFQKKTVFEPSTQTLDNPLPPGLDRLTVRMHDMSFEQLSQLWATQGSHYVPSVVYEVRLLPAKERMTQA